MTLYQSTDLPDGQLTCTETQRLQLFPGTRYSIAKSGTQGSATEVTINRVLGDSVLTYEEDDGTVPQQYEIITPPSGLIELYLPSAAGTSILLEWRKAGN